MRANASVGRWGGSFLGGLLIFLVAGCPVPFEMDSPYDSTLLGSESLVGSKKELIREKIGEPSHELKDKDKSYFIYRRLGESWGLAFLWFVPVGYIPSSENSSVLHCALLEFDQNDILNRYDIKKRYELWTVLSRIDCRSLFWTEGELAALEDLREAERRATLEVCNLPFSEVIQLDARTQYNLGTMCPTVSSGDPQADPLRWQRTCLAAHERYPDAQRRMGTLYHRGTTPQGQDSLLAYLWFSLAGDAQYALWLRDLVTAEMTPDQIAEAERLVAAWEPNPTECALSNEEIHALEARAKAEN